MDWQSFKSFKMNCQVKVSALLLVVCILIAGVLTAEDNTEMPQSEYKELQTKLESSNYSELFLGRSVRILYITSARQEASARQDGMEHHILAKILMDGQLHVCCFHADESLPPQEIFNVRDVRLGAEKC